MTKNHDYQHRAAEFLRQWQEQMTRQMTNPDTIAAMLAAMQQFGAPPHDANARRPAHAPDARDDAIGDLAKRLHAVERAITQLASRMDTLATKTQKSTRATQRADAKPVAKGKRAVPAAKRPVVKRKPVAKPRNKK